MVNSRILRTVRGSNKTVIYLVGSHIEANDIPATVHVLSAGRAVCLRMVELIELPTRGHDKRVSSIAVSVEARNGSVVSNAHCERLVRRVRIDDVSKLAVC